MDHKQALITILTFNRETNNAVSELSVQYASGVLTETEFLKGVIDLANRTNAVPKESLEEFAKGAFPYGVAAGKWEDDGENCKYSDDFASLRDAIVAWEEYNTMPWSRIEFRVDNFVYGLDPAKIRKAQKMKMDDGETRTIYMPCDANGHFINR